MMWKHTFAGILVAVAFGIGVPVAAAQTTVSLSSTRAGSTRATSSGPAWASRAKAQFRTVDVPGASGTAVNGVNNRGTLVGTWFNSQNQGFGFVEQPGGQPTTFNYPGTTGMTFPSGINDVGTSVGVFQDSSGVFHGWVRSPGGSMTQLDDPSAFEEPGFGTFAIGINDNGVIVGFYFATLFGSPHGFVDDHGTFRTLDFPGSSGTILDAVNNSGAIVGDYTDAAIVNHGFIYQKGTFTAFDAPDAGTGFQQGTLPVGISSSGVIDGEMINNAGTFGWVLSKGQFLSVNDPNAPAASNPLGMSSNGHLVSGQWFDGVTSHGYVATLTP